MRQTHVGGDKLFVDYAGDTVPVIVQVMLIHVNSAKEPCHHAFAPPSLVARQGPPPSRQIRPRTHKSGSANRSLMSASL
jgi:hypothetical protein